MTDNLPAEKAEPRAVAELTSSQIWNDFQAIARDPDIDAEKMRTLYDLQKQVMNDTRQEEFNQAKFAAMDDMPTIKKNKAVYTKSGELMYRYSDFKSLYLTVKPILQKHGLILDFDVDESSLETKVPMLRVAPILRHRNGYVWNGSYMPVPITAPNSSITLTQASKGAVESGKRTTMIACLGITEEEDESITGEQKAAPRDGSSINEDLLAAGMRATTGGPKAYAAWLQTLSNVQKGDLIKEGHHDDLSARAKERA